MAQTTLQVKGLVTSTNCQSGQPGARVSVDGIQQMTMTDEQGTFTLVVPSYDVCLTVSAPGCVQQKVYLQGRQTVQVKLLSENPESVENMNLQGEALSIRESGSPGAATRLFVRGMHSIHLTSQPLYLVDGVVWDMQEDAVSSIDGFSSNPLNLIDEDDIERVEILNNGTAIWGAKAAGGVVSITTKRAHDMATRIEANISMGVQQKCSSLPMMKAADYRRYATDVMRGMDAKTVEGLLFTNDDLSRLSYYDTHNATDWLEQINQHALLQKYGINVAGGDERALYRFSIGYAHNDGAVKGSNFNRLNVRFNSDIFLTERFSVASDIYYSNTDSRVSVAGMDEVASPYYVALAKSPLYAPYQRNASGMVTNRMSDVDELNVTNPIALIDDQMPQVTKQRFVISLRPTYKFSDRLKLTALLSYQWDKENQDSFLPDGGVTDMPLTNANGEVYAVGLNEVRNLMGRQNILSAQVFADWQVMKGWRHSWKAQAGWRFAHAHYRYSAGRGFNTGSDFMKALSNTNSSLRWITGDSYTVRDMAWFVQSRYEWMQRYGVDASVAIQTSSRYGSDAGGLGLCGVAWMPTAQVEAYWNIGAERWMQSLRGVDAKLRLGWNMTGNDQLPINASRTYLRSSAFAQNAVGNVVANVANEQLKWETTREWNLGIDLSFFNHRWQLSANLYRATTDDLLSRCSLAEESGLEYYWANGGKLRNTGWTLATDVRAINRKDWQLTVGATAADAAAAGLSVKNANGSLTAFGAGDMKFVDHCKDGIIDDKDRVIIGDPNPDVYGSFQASLSWKRFTLTPVFTFSVGGDVYNALRAQLESGSSLNNQTTAMNNRWTADGQVTSMPRATYGDPMGNARFSDRWIEDGSYLRMKTLTLSYDIPFQSTMLQNIRVWASVNNLFTLTRYLGADPESSCSSSVLAQGIDAGLLPQSRSFVLGVKVNL